MTVSLPQSDVSEHKHPDTIVNGKHLDDVIADLTRNGSIELIGGSEQHIMEQIPVLPVGMSVYMPALPGRSLFSNIRRYEILHEAGFNPIPHIAARRIPSKEALEKFLKRVVKDCGVHQVLLVGGDLDEPAGPYADSAAVLRDGVLEEAGIQEVGMAAYPEGHPRITSDQLKAAFDEKLALTSTKGLGAFIVTQFSFVPSRIIGYCDWIAHHAPNVPVFVGMAGPTEISALIRYARLCGVSTSIRGLSDMGFKAAKLLIHADPSEQLTMLARYFAGHEMSSIVGVHIFSFGGFAKSAQWMRDLQTKNF